jgi:RND family efflux transporter MFP subunit
MTKTIKTVKAVKPGKATPTTQATQAQASQATHGTLAARETRPTRAQTTQPTQAQTTRTTHGTRLTQEARATRGIQATLVAIWAFISLFALLATGACSRQPTQDVETEDKVPVATAAASRGIIRPLVSATGTVRPAPGGELVITAPQAARIAAMPKAVGDPVRRGDLLVRFDIPSLAADTGERRAAEAGAEARLTNARAAENRSRGLFERGIAARKELEDAEREMADAAAVLAAARTAHAAAGELAGRAVVRAPFDGIVAARGHNPGELVDPSAADPILRLIDPSRLQVEAAVPLAELAQVAVGSLATIAGPAGFPPERAKLLTRPAAVDSATSTAVVRLAFAAPTHLPAGTPVRVEIEGPPRGGAVLVPAAALVEEGVDSFVFVIDAQGKAHRRRVQVGVVAGGSAEIRAGVSPGEAVVISGQNGLPDGASTQPAAAPAAGSAGSGIGKGGNG